MGIDPGEATVTLDCRDLPLRSALSLILEQYDLVWTIDGQVLRITTPEVAECLLKTTVYEVSDLVRALDGQGRVWADFDSLIDVITSGVEPAGWEDVGGPGMIHGISLRNGEALVVRQTFHVQRQVAELLDELRALANKKAKADGAALPPFKPRMPGYWCGGFGGMGGVTGGAVGGGMGGGFFNTQVPGQTADSPADGGAGGGGMTPPSPPPPPLPCGPVPPPPRAPTPCGAVGGMGGMGMGGW
jgi:hypothetical protein